MSWVPKVGDRVKLNSKGFKSLRLDSEEAFEQAKSMRLTYVRNIGHGDAPIYSMEVDAPLINRYLLDHEMFDLLSDDA